MHVPPAAYVPAEEREIRVVSHSNLFYWWPVWLVGFIMAILTYIDGTRMVVVPSGSDAVANAVEIDSGAGKKYENRDVLVLPDKQYLPRTEPGDPKSDPVSPAKYPHMSHKKTYGVVYAIILLLVIVITNVPLRGMWSVVVLIVIFLVSIIFALAGWWEEIIRWLGLLDIRINAAGYLVVAIALFAIWLVTLVFFDQQVYMVFTSGQLKVRTEIGGGETAYDTQGMTIQKQRSDLFRHWILGLGSGDLIVNTSGAQAHHFDLPNVLFVGNKVQRIETMLREKQVVRGG
jgi:hypothetical protein